MKSLKTARLLSVCLFFFYNKTTAQQTGYACIYSEKHCGSRVATGGRLDCEKMTAAHRTLKLGSKVRVTNLDNSKSILVTINDRGPYSKKDIIDLTPSAAKKIGLTIGLGRVKVKIEKIVD